MYSESQDAWEMKIRLYRVSAPAECGIGGAIIDDEFSRNPIRRCGRRLCVNSAAMQLWPVTHERQTERIHKQWNAAAKETAFGPRATPFKDWQPKPYAEKTTVLLRKYRFYMAF
jgi:hypothetical protein